MTWYAPVLPLEIALLGLACLRGVGPLPECDALARFGYSYVVGSLVFGLLSLAWWAAGEPIGFELFSGGCCVLACLVLLVRRRAPTAGARSAGSGYSWGEILALSAIFALLFDRILAGNVELQSVGDEASIWSAKARAMFIAAGDLARFRTELLEHAWHRDYPVLPSVLQFASFAREGGLQFIDHRWPIEVFQMASLSIAYASVRRYVPAWIAVGMVLLLAMDGTVARFAAHACADGMLAAGAIAAVDAWLRYERTGSRGYHRVFVLALTLLVLTKNEGSIIALVCVTGAALGGVRRFLPVSVLWLLPVACVAGTWVWNARSGFTNDLAGTSEDGETLGRFLSHFAQRAWPVTEYVGRDLLGLAGASRGLIGALLLLVALFPLRFFRSEARLPGVVVLTTTFVYAGVFVATPHSLDWHLTTAAHRILMPMTCVAALGLATSISDIWPALRSARVVDARCTPVDVMPYSGP